MSYKSGKKANTKKLDGFDVGMNMHFDDIVNSYGSQTRQQGKPPKPPRPPIKPIMPTDGYFAPTVSQPVGTVYKPTYNTGNIQEMWDKKTKSDIGTLDANVEKEKGQLNSQRDKAGVEYRGLRNQATATHAMQERARKESMANMGLSGAGGTSRSFQQSATNNLNNQIGSIKLQERQYGEEVDRALRDIQSKYSAEVNSILANNNLQSTTQQIQSDQFKAGHDLAAAQYNTGLDQWNKQFGWTKENTKISHLIDLLKAKKISKKQFEAISGMKL